MYGSEYAFVALIALQGCAGLMSCSTCVSRKPEAVTSTPDSPAASVPIVAAAKPEPGIQPVNLPSALAALTTGPELSGIAWSEALQRYLVVSDDTGRSDEGTNHAAWVLGLTRDGSLDEAPIPVAGIHALNDPESICRGPDGTFFLTTSHSANKKGKTPESRRQLLLVEPSGGQLRVLGSVDLTTVRGKDGANLLALAGLDPSGALDIEAVIWRNDELFIGLKSPLDASGDATILKMTEASKALRASQVPEGAVSLWRRAQLCVPAGSARVCEGISDLAFLPDGGLALVANSPKGATTDGGGALWLIPPSPADAPARLVRRFAGMKPEGLALSPDDRALVIVFDRDRQQPVWMQWPLPL